MITTSDLFSGTEKAVSRCSACYIVLCDSNFRVWDRNTKLFLSCFYLCACKPAIRWPPKQRKPEMIVRDALHGEFREALEREIIKKIKKSCYEPFTKRGLNDGDNA